MQAAWVLGVFVFRSRDLPNMVMTIESDGNLQKKKHDQKPTPGY